MSACECGCGESTAIAKHTDRRTGTVKGQPRRFINGHNARKRRDWEEAPGPLPTPCWKWMGTINTEGYGVLRVNYKQFKAHRWVYEQIRGPLPDDGRVPDHLCRVRACVNPDHIEWVTVSMNRRRGAGIVLSESLCAHLREKHAQGMSCAEIAKQSGLHSNHVRRVLNGEIWA